MGDRQNRRVVTGLSAAAAAVLLLAIPTGRATAGMVHPVTPTVALTSARAHAGAHARVPAGAPAGGGLVRQRTAELARAIAGVATLSGALTGLQTHAEIAAERYDREVSLAQQAAAAYRVTVGRLAAARRAEERDRQRLAQLAAEAYEADGGPDLATAMLAQVTDPQGYLAALGEQQVLAGRQADLLAASQADEIVTRLFARQAASLLAGQRAAAQAAGFFKLAVEAAVRRQLAEVRKAEAARSRLAAELASARAGAAKTGSSKTGAPAAGSNTPDFSSYPASVQAGGPSGAAPGVFAPDWAPDAGASAAQGNTAANWALTQLGKPYRWGGAGPAFYDCSGLALDAWATAGVRLYHWTGFQWVSGPHEPLRRLRRGDLVFYATNIADPASIHHVGIYIGNGLMVDAPYTGAVVRIDSLSAYAGLIGATRPAQS
jgi:cell wall-associated NlpC family hydrolase